MSADNMIPPTGSGAFAGTAVQDVPVPERTTDRDEIERLDPQPQTHAPDENGTPKKLQLKSGIEFDVEPLKLRQFLALLRIMTRGAAGIYAMGAGASLTSGNLDGEAFARELLTMVVFAIPEAEDETVEFAKSIVRPAKLTGNKTVDDELRQLLSAELDNPELEDLVSIIEVVVNREGNDLKALGKRLGGMMKVADKIGATKNLPMA